MCVAVSSISTNSSTFQAPSEALRHEPIIEENASENKNKQENRQELESMANMAVLEFERSSRPWYSQYFNQL